MMRISSSIDEKNKITTNYNKILHETTKEGDDLYGKRDIPLCF